MVSKTSVAGVSFLGEGCGSVMCQMAKAAAGSDWTDMGNLKISEWKTHTGCLAKYARDLSFYQNPKVRMAVKRLDILLWSPTSLPEDSLANLYLF